MPTDYEGRVAVYFRAANAEKQAASAESLGARAAEALRVLGGSVSAEHEEAARLRIAYPSATLTELGALADPPLTKDAIGGRLRRLIGAADRHLRNQGTLPGTPERASVTRMSRRRKPEPPPGADDSRKLPFWIRCSDGHGSKGARLLYRGVLASAAGEPPLVDWSWGKKTPPLGEPDDNGDRKVTLKCSVCGLDRQMRLSLMAKALRELSAAGLGDRTGCVTLDLAYVPR